MIPKYGDTLVFWDDGESWHNGTDFPSQSLVRVSWASNPKKAIAWVYFGHVNLDFDGSSTAYGPAALGPDDDLGNAGNATQGWFGVASMTPEDPLVKSGEVKIDKTAPALLGKYPVVQQKAKGDPHDGFYVSATSRPDGPEYRQGSHIDASAFPFGALSLPLTRHPYDMSMGDYGVAIRHDDSSVCPFYFADGAGNGHKVGECAFKVGTELGVVKKGRHWDNNFPVSFIIFPHSANPSRGTRVSVEDARADAAPFLAPLGQAPNYFDLALLMGFNETSPPHRPRGASKLADYGANPWKRRPTNVDTIFGSLQGFGYAKGKGMPPLSMALPPKFR